MLDIYETGIKRSINHPTQSIINIISRRLNPDNKTSLLDLYYEIMVDSYKEIPDGLLVNIPNMSVSPEILQKYYFFLTEYFVNALSQRFGVYESGLLQFVHKNIGKMLQKHGNPIISFMEKKNKPFENEKTVDKYKNLENNYNQLWIRIEYELYKKAKETFSFHEKSLVHEMEEIIDVKIAENKKEVDDASYVAIKDSITLDGEGKLIMKDLKRMTLETRKSSQSILCFYIPSHIYFKTANEEIQELLEQHNFEHFSFAFDPNPYKVEGRGICMGTIIAPDSSIQKNIQKTVLKYEKTKILFETIPAKLALTSNL